MFFRRLTSLFRGKFTRWLKPRESRDPEAVYEAAIADRVKRYQQLKTAAAGVIYMRTKLERELKDKTAELAEVAGAGGSGGRPQRGSMRADSHPPQARAGTRGGAA